MKVGDFFYSKKFIGCIVEDLGDGVFAITFDSRDGSEHNYNKVSMTVIESMIDQKEWFTGGDPFKGV
jgi:hypothetical protein